LFGCLDFRDKLPRDSPGQKQNVINLSAAFAVPEPQGINNSCGHQLKQQTTTSVLSEQVHCHFEIAVILYLIWPSGRQFWQHRLPLYAPKYVIELNGYHTNYLEL
jgi:hypothetical protein